jgi:hypothetical protein
MRPHLPPPWLDEVPPPRAGEGGLVLGVCALVALVALEPRLLHALAFGGSAALAPVARAMAIAVGLWGWL